MWNESAPVRWSSWALWMSEFEWKMPRKWLATINGWTNVTVIQKRFSVFSCISIEQWTWLNARRSLKKIMKFPLALPWEFSAIFRCSQHQTVIKTDAPLCGPSSFQSMCTTFFRILRPLKRLAVFSPRFVYNCTFCNIMLHMCYETFRLRVQWTREVATSLYCVWKMGKLLIRVTKLHVNDVESWLESSDSFSQIVLQIVYIGILNNFSSKLSHRL